VASRIYLEPTARLRPAPGTAVPVLTVAGVSELAFAAVVRIERDGSDVRRRLELAGEVRADRGIPAELIERLTRPRAAIAGLALDRPRLMGIINVTPDSFFDGGLHPSAKAAIDHGLRLAGEGADILDIGGESTRPGAAPVDVATELSRVLPVLQGLAGRTSAVLSIDTRKAEVMRRAAAAGASMVNDVSALTHDPESLGAAAQLGLPVVLMHSRGDPATMQVNPVYADVVLDVYDKLEARIIACEGAGIPRARLIVDPGIGFGKTLAHNCALLGSLSIFHGLGCALLLGASRKSFIAGVSGADPARRLSGSLAAAIAGAARGVQLLRVHDVAETRQALAVWERIGAGG
jgi:dihydropteroate synthase